MELEGIIVNYVFEFDIPENIKKMEDDIEKKIKLC